ncbi:TPA: hypothetical protein REU56_002926, partial [Listeria monocytogenes]|nr:hypothetical protein [Listeria monocytogenes]
MANSQTVNTVNYVIRDGFETINTDLWDIQQGNGDILELAGNVQGSGYLKISKSILNEDTETVLTSKFSVDAPVKIGLGMSLSQRLNGQRFSIEMVGVGDDGQILTQIPINLPVPLASVSQTTTTLTVTTQTPHGFLPNDRIQIFGVSDSRANYGEVYVATVTSSTVFTVTSTPYTTITSATIAAV